MYGGKRQGLPTGPIRWTKKQKMMLTMNFSCFSIDWYAYPLFVLYPTLLIPGLKFKEVIQGIWQLDTLRLRHKLNQNVRLVALKYEMS